MKLLIILLIPVFFLNCNTNVKSNLNYCLILEMDQSNLEPTLNANEKRGNLILDNWKLLLNELQNSPNLKVEISTTGPDSCKFNAYMFTLTHVSQSFPEELYNMKTIKLIEQKINENVINKDILYTACKVTSFGSYKTDFKPLFIYALKSWQLDTTLFNGTKFY